MPDNPFLSTTFEIPFQDLTPDALVPAMREALATASDRLEELRAPRPDPTYDDTLQALDDLVEDVIRPYRLARHLVGVMDGPELRAAYNEVLPEVTGFLARLTTDHEVWLRLSELAATDEGQALSGVRERHLAKTLDEFRRAGAHLPEADRQRVEALRVELARLTTKFSENVLDSANAFELIVEDEARLEGLPATSLRRARALAASKGLEGYRFTLQAPSYVPFLKYVEDRDLRREMYEAYFAVATAEPHDNRPVIRQILAARRELAQLLGYQDFADLQTEDRMIKSGARAAAFEDDLTRRTRPYFEAEVEELREFSATRLGMRRLEPWDLSFVGEKLRLERYAIDDEALRPYFPLPQVLDGLFELAQRLFGVTVRQVDGVPTWHPEVAVYHVNHEDGTFLGAMYADWYPRESKRDGAWMAGLVTGGPTADGFDPHLGVVACNFTPPEGGNPALLTHSEVETLFHEFGHLLHHVMCRVEVRARSSGSVPWDFVELPSQIMENWTWEKEALDLFAKHHETGETLPQELFERLAASRNFLEASAQMRQLMFGTVDLALHREYDPAGEQDPVEFGRSLMAEMEFRADFARPGRLARFTHIFSGGYAAGYYSYKWSEVLDADAFGRFREEGIFDPDTGRRFANSILSRGDSVDVEELFREFMGRDPDLNALIRRSLGESALPAVDAADRIGDDAGI